MQNELELYDTDEKYLRIKWWKRLYIRSIVCIRYCLFSLYLISFILSFQAVAVTGKVKPHSFISFVARNSYCNLGQRDRIWKWGRNHVLAFLHYIICIMIWKFHYITWLFILFSSVSIVFFSLAFSSSLFSRQYLLWFKEENHHSYFKRFWWLSMIGKARWGDVKELTTRPWFPRLHDPGGSLQSRKPLLLPLPPLLLRAHDPGGQTLELEPRTHKYSQLCNCVCQTPQLQGDGTYLISNSVPLHFTHRSCFPSELEMQVRMGSLFLPFRSLLHKERTDWQEGVSETGDT